jgi:hypothetical protein
MRRGRFTQLLLAAGVLAAGPAGCGTTRMTDTNRAATEMLLISQAVDGAVAKLDFSELAGKTVYLDVLALDGVVDRGYLASSLRQHLLAHGALLSEERNKATYVVEARTGALGTDRHTLLLGTPQVSLPSIMPGVPTSIPEIALAKKSDQKGIAKVAVFAYNRQTGRALWQSGLVETTSSTKDTWLFGAGPFRRGTLHGGTSFAGEELPNLPHPFVPRDHAAEGADPSRVALNKPASWKNADLPAGGPVSALPVSFHAIAGPVAGILIPSGK